MTAHENFQIYSILELWGVAYFFKLLTILISSLNPHGYPPLVKDTTEKHLKFPHCTKAQKEQNHVQLAMTSTEFKVYFEGCKIVHIEFLKEPSMSQFVKITHNYSHCILVFNIQEMHGKYSNVQISV